MGKPFWLETRLCPACDELAAAEAVAAVSVVITRERESKWQVVCPAVEYRETNIDDPRLHPVCVSTVKSWDVRGRRGIGLVGNSGFGKTRCLFVALRRAFDASLSCAAVSHRRIAALATAASNGAKVEREEASATLTRFHRCQVLLLDDLGKGAFTPRANEELSDLLEHRTSSGLPVLWSANGGGEWLIKQLGPDYGPPIARRLADFCELPALTCE